MKIRVPFSVRFSDVETAVRDTAIPVIASDAIRRVLTVEADERDLDGGPWIAWKSSGLNVVQDRPRDRF